jgi:feruloyl esterase
VLQGPGGKAAAPPDAGFCRVKATVTPTAGSDIGIEIWLPLDEKWNGKFYGTGNGGAGGRIVYSALLGGIGRGFAVANTDLGTHVGTPPSMRFGVGRPDLRANYTYRAVHAMTEVGKEAVRRFYGRQASKSIFSGCSAGGFEAMGEAIRFPKDYDGIIAGDPAINFAPLALFQGYSYAMTHRTPASAIPVSLLPTLAAEAIRQCDALDGLKDGLISDPRQCRVDWSRIACHPGMAEGCANPDQIVALQAIYAGLRNPRNGRLIYPGFNPGAEATAGAKVRLSDAGAASLNTSAVPGPLTWVLPANWVAADWLHFDFGADSERMLHAFAPYENNSPDLGAFRAHGGKFILYTGWADPNISPIDHAYFYERVIARTGGDREFSRFFAAPGMNHCGGGPGPNNFGQGAAGTGPNNDVVAAMERWVDGGPAPERLVATKFRGDDPSQGIERTRPLCAFPRVARWDRRGSIDDAASFSCVGPAQDDPHYLASLRQNSSRVR